MLIVGFYERKNDDNDRCCPTTRISKQMPNNSSRRQTAVNDVARVSREQTAQNFLCRKIVVCVALLSIEFVKFCL